MFARLKRGREKQFYFLWNPESKLVPNVRFSTKNETHTIAVSMARAHRHQFYVLRAVSFAGIEIIEGDIR